MVKQSKNKSKQFHTHNKSKSKSNQPIVNNSKSKTSKQNSKHR